MQVLFRVILFLNKIAHDLDYTVKDYKILIKKYINN